MSSIVAPGKDFTLTFLHWRDILFSSIPDTMESPTMSVVFLLHLWWISFFKLIFLVPLSDFTSCCLVALNAEWYCWRISFSWWSNLALLICPCSCCCVSGDELLFSLHLLLMLSLTVLQFWKFSKICFVEVFEGVAINCSFATFNWLLFWAIENLLELIVSLMWLAFSEVFLICKLLQEKFVSSCFVVTPINKCIKLSITFCYIQISSLSFPFEVTRLWSVITI